MSKQQLKQWRGEEETGVMGREEGKGGCEPGQSPAVCS